MDASSELSECETVEARREEEPTGGGEPDPGDSQLAPGICAPSQVSGALRLGAGWDLAMPNRAGRSSRLSKGCQLARTSALSAKSRPMIKLSGRFRSIPKGGNSSSATL